MTPGQASLPEVGRHIPTQHLSQERKKHKRSLFTSQKQLFIVPAFQLLCFDEVFLSVPDCTQTPPQPLRAHRALSAPSTAAPVLVGGVELINCHVKGRGMERVPFSTSAHKPKNIKHFPCKKDICVVSPVSYFIQFRLQGLETLS